MKTLLISTLFLFCSSLANSADIQPFNTNVLGEKISSAISLLEKTSGKNDNWIMPKVIQVDVKGEKYSAASIYYSAEDISPQKIIEFIDKKYPGTRSQKVESEIFWAWRIDEQQFGITFSSQIEDGLYRLIYVKYFEWQ